MCCAVGAGYTLHDSALVASLLGPFMKWIGVTDPGAIGLAAGFAGSGIGASRVIPRHPLSAALAAAAISLNGLITGALAPAFARMLRHW